MNNPSMYSLEDDGGTPYPETEKYSYDRWYMTTGLTDGSAYKTIRLIFVKVIYFFTGEIPIWNCTENSFKK